MPICLCHQKPKESNEVYNTLAQLVFDHIFYLNTFFLFFFFFFFFFLIYANLSVSSET